MAGITAEIVGGPLDGQLINVSDPDGVVAIMVDAGTPLSDGTPRLYAITVEVSPQLTADGWRLYWPHEDTM